MNLTLRSTQEKPNLPPPAPSHVGGPPQPPTVPGRGGVARGGAGGAGAHCIPPPPAFPQVEGRVPGYGVQAHSYGASGRHEHAAAVRPEFASSSRPEYGFPPQEPQMEPGVFYGYQNWVAPNLDSSDKNPPMSYALPEATPQMKNEQVLAVNPQGTVRSISPSGYEDSGRLTVNAAWAPKGWFQVNATGRLHRIYGDQVNRG